MLRKIQLLDGLYAAISMLSNNHTIYKVAATEDEARYMAKTASMPGSDINALFRIRQLPADWKATLQRLHQQPIPINLCGKKEGQIWKD